MEPEPVRWLRLDPITSDRAYELERHAAIQVLTEMIDVHGLESIERWTRDIAAMLGGKGGR